MRKFKQIKLLLILIFFAVTSMLLNSCYPDYGLTVEDFDVVATFKDDAANFQTYNTYFMPDSVQKLFDGLLGSPINSQLDEAILTEIENQMQSYGYQKVNNQANADLYLFVGITTSESYVYDPGYWGGYYGWYYPWYGGYAYSYSTGSLFLTLIDKVKFNDANKIVGAVWAGTANGVVEDSKANIKVRTLNSIDKMFNQSPYLKIIE